MTAFCFMHIGKVGGSAVIRELARRFAGRRIVHVSPWSMDASRVVRDHQTRFLGGDWRDHAPVDDATFSRALKNVETFDVVGVHESYGQSMAILCDRMGWPPWPTEVRVNETADRTPVDRLSAKVTACVCELNPCTWKSSSARGNAWVR